MNNLVGQNISGYQILEHIAKGSYGSVYRATHPAIDHDVVVKVLLSKHLEDTEALQRFESEADVIATLNNHPNIVPIYDYWKAEDGAYLVLKYLGGGSLRDLLKQGKPLKLNQVSYLIDRLAGALYAAHERGIVHRDLKPGNVLFDKNGKVYLADFGIAKQMGKNITAPNAVIGTPAYLAPEQIIARHMVSPQTDIYALGLVLYETLTGHRPFEDKVAVKVMLRQLNDHLPLIPFEDATLERDINYIIQTATAKKPDLRYLDVQEMAVALRQVATVHSS